MCNVKKASSEVNTLAQVKYVSNDCLSAKYVNNNYPNIKSSAQYFRLNTKKPACLSHFYLKNVGPLPTNVFQHHPIYKICFREKNLLLTSDWALP